MGSAAACIRKVVRFAVLRPDPVTPPFLQTRGQPPRFEGVLFMFIGASNRELLYLRIGGSHASQRGGFDAASLSKDSMGYILLVYYASQWVSSRY
jgi:hypothetical protein